MDDLDRILSVVVNPTRRRILQAIVREPHYPLQLSKELGISQQSVVKNLDVMERNGMVVHYRQSSNVGPDRILYRPSSEFTILIDLRNGMFETHMVSPETKNEDKEKEDTKIEETKEFQETRNRISDIDRQLKELNEVRSQMIGERNRLIRSFLDSIDDKVIDYDHRNLLYEMLNNPDMDKATISKEMGVNESSVDQMIDDLLSMLQ
ncbi:MAG: helix-turn-helix domain-containing protein [Candidatus Methanomethylophilaceae archaeon]|jgi:ArsR family transcriptional regulator